VNSKSSVEFLRIHLQIALVGPYLFIYIVEKYHICILNFFSILL